MIHRILIVEDEPKIAALLVDYLQTSGFRGEIISDGSQVVEHVRRQSPDLILLDLMLPGQDGLSICRELRGFSAVPIFIITARVEEIDRLLGLELGADDYICKPFSPREVIARIKALQRRLQPPPSDDSTVAGFVTDTEKMQIRYHDQVLDLTPNEYRLLAAMLARPGRVFSRDALLDRLGDDSREVSDRAIDSHVKNIRKKIALLLPNQTVIQSVYGVGYRLELTN